MKIYLFFVAVCWVFWDLFIGVKKQEKILTKFVFCETLKMCTSARARAAARLLRFRFAEDHSVVQEKGIKKQTSFFFLEF